MELNNWSYPKLEPTNISNDQRETTPFISAGHCSWNKSCLTLVFMRAQQVYEASVLFSQVVSGALLYSSSPNTTIRSDYTNLDG